MASFILLLPACLAVIPFFILPLFAATQSWRSLFIQQHKPKHGQAMQWTWIAFGVNWLLPVAMVGGELVKLRLIFTKKVYMPALIASVIGDKTIQVATQLLYAVVGLLLLALLSKKVVGGIESVGVLILFIAAIYAFYKLQRSRMFTRLASHSQRFFRDKEKLELDANSIDSELNAMYSRRKAWWTAVFWRMAFRVLLAFEIWLGLWWLGHPVTLFEAVVLESIAQGARAAAFFIPAGLGAQEGGIVAAGLLLGLPGESLIAVAMLKRVRELAVGGLGLLAWQAQEARLLYFRR